MNDINKMLQVNPGLPPHWDIWLLFLSYLQIQWMFVMLQAS